jgi:hypothetical protein
LLTLFEQLNISQEDKKHSSQAIARRLEFFPETFFNINGCEKISDYF